MLASRPAADGTEPAAVAVT